MDNFIAHILVVDDDEGIRSLVKKYLNENNFLVSTADSAESASKKIEIIEFDLIILDIMMPGKTGLQFLKEIRQNSRVPILMLTAMSSTEDRIDGLETGADDYICKPFSLDILLARVKAVLRRANRVNNEFEDIVDLEGIKIVPKTRKIFIDNVETELTFTEFQILHLLASHPGWVFTRYQIIDRIRGEKYPVTDRSVDFQIVGLRKKMGLKGKLIETIRGVGYRFHHNET